MKKYFCTNFSRILQISPIYPFLKKWGLLDQFKLSRISREKRFYTEEPSLVFLAKGLLKQFYGKEQHIDGPSFIQFIQPDTLFVYGDRSEYPEIKVMNTSYVITLPIETLEPFLLKDKLFRQTLDEILDLNYGSNFFLSTYLNELQDPDLQFLLLLDIYGDKLNYLQQKEIAMFSGIKEHKIYSYIYHHFVKYRL